jgi:UDP-glucose 4-epimerase
MTIKVHSSDVDGLSSRSPSIRLHCLVLGGAGFIGSHLVDGLLANGHRVRIFDRPGVPVERFEGNSMVELVQGDLSNSGEISDALQGCDICFHLVSTTLPKSSNADPLFDLETNLVSTVRMLRLAEENGIRKVVFLSSGGTVYGRPQYLPIDEAHPTDPLCSYGITKLGVEKYLELFRILHGLEYTVLRLSNPFGERQRLNASQGAVAVFLGKVRNGEAVEIWGDGSVVRDYIHVSDVISAMLACIDYSGDHRVLNIGSGMGLSLNEVLEGIERVTGRIARKVYAPGRAFDVPTSVLDIGLAKRELQWQPTITFEAGLTRMSDWLDDQP